MSFLPSSSHCSSCFNFSRLVFFFFNDTATTEIYTLFPTRRSSDLNRLIDGGGVRVDGTAISDRGLKLEAGTYVVQVGDRKSTRLNSSHSQISYAVFCLKKKNHIHVVGLGG